MSSGLNNPFTVRVRSLPRWRWVFHSYKQQDYDPEGKNHQDVLTFTLLFKACKRSTLLEANMG
eukprot:9052960-Prorocentrum_lima.AAC.1